MSTATPQATTPQRDEARLAVEIETLFAQATASGPQPRLRTLAGACQFDLAGAGTWRATIKDGMVAFAKGADDTTPARCVIACDAGDFLRFVRREGNMNLMTAFMQELMTVTGDLPFAFAALSGFVLASEGEHAGEHPQEEYLGVQGATP